MSESDIELEIEFEDEPVAQNITNEQRESNGTPGKKEDTPKNQFKDAKYFKLPTSTKDEIDQKFQDFEVVSPYSCKLQLSDISLESIAGSTKFYLIQVLKLTEGNETKKIGLLCKWGKSGGSVDYTFDEFLTLDEAIERFKAKFEEKTYNEWDNRETFNAVVGGYNMLGAAPDVKVEVDGKKAQSLEEMKFKEKLETIDMRMFTEICNQRFELSDTLKSMLSINDASKLFTEFGIDQNQLNLSNLTSSTVASAHSILCEIQKELLREGRRTKKIFELSVKFDEFIPLNKKSSSNQLIENFFKLKQRFYIIHNLRGLVTLLETIRDLQPEAYREDNPINTIFKRMECQMVKVEKETEEFNHITQMMTSHGKTHSNFDLFIKDVFSVRKEGEEARFFPFKKISKKLLWHGSRKLNVFDNLRYLHLFINV